MTPDLPVLIAAGGVVTGLDLLRPELTRDRFAAVIAANGGHAHLQALGLPPDFRIGDFDSAPPGDIPPPARTVRFPTNKDQTDLELALDYAVQTLKAQELLVIGTTGGRLDHTLANINLGAAHAARGTKVVYLDGDYRLHFMTSSLSFAPRFPTVSLIPHTDAVHVAGTGGLTYPLTDEPLLRTTARGVSNVAAAPIVEIRITSGLLLVLESRV
jgi:thiamine pyrophosphokinase